jgi:hypothetical protein
MDSPKAHLSGGKQEVEVGAPSLLVLSHWTVCKKSKELKVLFVGPFSALWCMLVVVWTTHGNNGLLYL